MASDKSDTSSTGDDAEATEPDTAKSGWPEGWVAADGWLTDLGELGLMREVRRKRQEAEARAADANGAEKDAEAPPPRR